MAQIKKQKRFSDKYGPWAVVTGASDGIGRAIAVRLAEAGLHLVLVARRRPVLLELASALATSYGIQTKVVDGDLAAQDVWKRVAEATVQLDVGLLVASAGFGTSGPFIEIGVDAELAMVDVNCRALLALTHEFSRRLVGRGRGGIILLSSLVGFQGVPFAANYAATKAYVQSLAEGLHHELRPHGVDVLASAPGPVQSGFARQADMHMGMALTPVQVAQATLDALGKKTTVRPGWLSKLLELSFKALPRVGRVRIMKIVMGRMTRHQKLDEANSFRE